MCKRLFQYFHIFRYALNGLYSSYSLCHICLHNSFLHFFPHARALAPWAGSEKRKRAVFRHLIYFLVDLHQLFSGKEEITTEPVPPLSNSAISERHYQWKITRWHRSILDALSQPKTAHVCSQCGVICRNGLQIAHNSLDFSDLSPSDYFQIWRNVSPTPTRAYILDPSVNPTNASLPSYCTFSMIVWVLLFTPSNCIAKSYLVGILSVGLEMISSGIKSAFSCLVCSASSLIT